MQYKKNKTITPIFDRDNVCYLISVLGKRIKIMRIGWENISEQKHTELAGKFSSVTNTIRLADEVWLSKTDPDAYLYYAKTNQKYICAICKHYNKEGFLITAYYTYKIQGVKKVWPK